MISFPNVRGRARQGSMDDSGRAGGGPATRHAPRHTSPRHRAYIRNRWDESGRREAIAEKPSACTLPVEGGSGCASLENLFHFDVEHILRRIVGGTPQVNHNPPVRANAPKLAANRFAHPPLHLVPPGRFPQGAGRCEPDPRTVRDRRLPTKGDKTTYRHPKTLLIHLPELGRSQKPLRLRKSLAGRDGIAVPATSLRGWAVRH